MVGCVDHCTPAVSHDVSNSYKSTLSLFDSKYFVAILYFFPPHFKLVSCVIVISQHPNTAPLCRVRGEDGGARGARGVRGADAALRCRARAAPAHFTFCGRIQFGHSV